MDTAELASTSPAGPGAQADGGYRWWVVAMLWLICFLNYADRQAIYSVFPALKASLHLTDLQLGLLGSAFMWVYALSAPLAGLLGDRLSRKGLVLSGLLFWSAITVATAFCHTFSQLAAVRALEGFGEAFYFPASMSLISDYHGSRTRSRAMAIHQSSVYAGTVAGGTLAGWLAESQGWQSAFYVFGVGGMLAAAVLVFFLREPPRERSEAVLADERTGSFRDSLRSALGHRMVPVLIIVFVGANFVAAVFLTWPPSYLFLRFHMNLAWAGFSSTAYLQVASVLGVVAGGFLADRWRRHYLGGRMMTQALGLFAGVPFLFLAGWTTSAGMLVLAITCFGFFKGLYDANIWASLYDVVPAAARATGLGTMNAIGWLGAGIAPVAIAAASAYVGLGYAIAATSVIYLFAGLALIAGVRGWTRHERRLA